MSPLTQADVADMVALSRRMEAKLPSPRWYFTSDEAIYADDLTHSFGYGIRQDGRLIAFAIACEGFRQDAGHSYAAIVGDEVAGSLDFKDMITDPDYRRMGLQSALQRQLAEDARRLGHSRMYCTIDPDNLPSRSAFEKAGYTAVMQRIAYDGRPRVYYRLML